ncbi:MAG: hypothetical protein V1827_03050 [Candidatus Micrarchaeota archaeon]
MDPEKKKNAEALRVSRRHDFRNHFDYLSSMDRLDELVEQDLPHGSLHCEMTVKQNSEKPTKGIPEEGDEAPYWGVFEKSDLPRTQKLHELLVFGSLGATGDLFMLSCADEKKCSPVLSKTFEQIIGRGATPEHLIRFIMKLSDLGIAWSENGRPGYLLLAHLEDMADAERAGLEPSMDSKCFARLAYATLLMEKAVDALASSAAESPMSLGPIVTALPEDVRPGFFFQFQSTRIFSESYSSELGAAFASFPEARRYLVKLDEKR